MKKLISILLIVFIPFSFCSCSKAPNGTNINGVPVAIPNSTVPTTTSPSNDLTTLVPSSVEEYNMFCINAANGIHIEKTCKINDSYVLNINANVLVSSVENIGLYEYIPTSITTSQRDALLSAHFGDQVNELVRSDINGETWILETESTRYRFGYSRGMDLIYEETYTLRDMKARIEEFDWRMLASIDEAELSISLESAYSMCERLLSTLTDENYIPTNVRPFTMNSESNEGMLWIVWRKTVDGMPIVADNDPKFYVGENRVLSMYGSVYTLNPIVLDQKIITLDAAITNLVNYSSRLNPGEGNLYLDHLFEKEIPVSKITLEYVVLRGTDMSYTVTPVWRFYIGATDEETLILEDRIIAINALTGDLIAERRGHTF